MSTQISDLATRIATITDTDYEAALTLATTYAAQCGYDVPEGGRAPHAEVSEDDAEFILESAGAATGTPSALDDIAAAARSIDEAIDRRDTLIRKAIADGVSRTHIAKAANLSRERIYQIRDGRR